ncbi:AfsR/SARP family transcriptional regulator [Rhizocola hellebori]|uniref:AfsR/SARP family transcriptional regulator n=1 Tax=Rhizocola hellebori TaxID=1392758 RepID=UPI001943E052|nr:BTAD domain-containing putative transcriptional regulator [Rhizocola hellebori]
MEIRILGPVELHANGRPVPLGARRQRFVLGVLALEVNHLVQLDQLVALTWPGDAPRTAVHAIQVIISGLRGVLAGAGEGDDGIQIATRGTGYLLRADPDCIDASRFLKLLGQAHATGEAQRRVPILDEALGLWSGSALSGAAPAEVLDRLCHRLETARVSAERDLIEARLAIGEHVQVTPQLERLSRELPFDEQIHQQLMLALYRAGRQADALAVYRRLRHALGSELGIDPSQPLRELESAILRQELSLSPAPDSPPPSAAPTPAQLPPALPAFAGRRGALATLDRLAAGQVNAAVVVISGTAGIGKTTLAAQWAHRVAARFPDGQLYVNLRGFGASGTALGPGVALAGFLEALAVPPERIPAGIEAQTAMYRSLVAGKRILVLLDNARDAEQVRPLLPGEAACLTVVTSRNRMAPLVATEGAYPLALELLTDEEARELLDSRLGKDRTATESDAVGQIIDRCARLPLALSVVAARAATHPQFPLSRLAAELHDAAGGLDAMHAGDSATDVRAVLSWSYRALSTAAADLFRLLGQHAGPDISVAAAASLAAVPTASLRPLLTELTEGNLLTEAVPDRFSQHDLLRAFAAELAQRLDPQPQRHAAIRRLQEHYLHTAHAAALLLNPLRDPIVLTPPRNGVAREYHADHRQALAWFTAEHQVLLAAITHAAGSGLDLLTWQLTWTLTTFLNRQGHWHDWATVWQLGLEAAERLGDPLMLAWTHRSLSWAYIHLGLLTEARVQIKRALGFYEQVDDRIGHADSHLDLGGIVAPHDPQEALDHAEQALDLYRAEGHEAGQAIALNNIGWAHTLLGNYQRGLAACQQSLALHQRLGNRDGQAGAWDSLGLTHHRLGHLATAVACYQRAIDLYRDLGDRYEEATSLTNLGDSLHDSDPDRARRAWRQALVILDELAHPDAESVRRKISGPS